MNFTLTYLVHKCALPGKAETWNLVIDMTGMGISNVPRRSMQQMLSSAQTMFRGRAYKIFIINANMIFRGSFKLISMMLDEFTA